MMKSNGNYECIHCDYVGKGKLVVDKKSTQAMCASFDGYVVGRVYCLKCGSQMVRM